MENPLVSICIPTFNGAQYLKEALLSAINQDYSDFEVIVSDDDSSDMTLDIVTGFKKRSPIPLHLYHHKPSGIGANWNNCVRKASGEYIKFLFQDDTLEPDCVDRMMNAAMKYETVGLVFCRRKIIQDHNNEPHKEWVNRYKNLHAHWESVSELQNGRSLLKDRNLLREPQNKIGEPTVVLLKKEVFEKVGYFNTKLQQALDLEFWFRVLTRFDAAFIDAELVSFRLHDNQASSINVSRNIVDHELYPKLLFRNFFFYLHREVRKELFFKRTLAGKILRKTGSRIRGLADFKGWS